MDRRPRKRPRLGWDVAPQALKEVNEMWASLGYYRQRMLLSHRSRFLSETDVANHTLFHKHSNQHKQEPSQQMHFSPAYFDSQKLPNFLQQPLGTLPNKDERVQKLIWVALCVLDQGGLIFRLQIACLQNYIYFAPGLTKSGPLRKLAWEQKVTIGIWS